MASKQVHTVANTSELDTLSLAKEAKADGFIKQGVLDCLTSLHPQVPNSMKRRYLLQHFHTQLQCYRSIPENFAKYDITAPVQSIFCDVSIGPEQLYQLNELLVSYAYKWREIGTALEFPPQELKNIEACDPLIHNSPMSYLTRLLEDWLLGKLKCTLPRTLGNLEHALKSQTVGLGAVANKLSFDKVSKSVVGVLSLPYSMTHLSLKKRGDCVLSQFVEFN